MVIPLLFVGYSGSDYYIAKGHWGTSWGDQGFAKIKMDTLDVWWVYSTKILQFDIPTIVPTTPTLNTYIPVSAVIAKIASNVFIANRSASSISSKLKPRRTGYNSFDSTKNSVKSDTKKPKPAGFDSFDEFLNEEVKMNDFV